MSRSSKSPVVAILKLAIAPGYRDEVVADLLDDERAAIGNGRSRVGARLDLYRHLLRNAIDSRLAARRRPEIPEHGGERGPKSPRILSGLGADLKMAWRLHSSRPGLFAIVLITLALASGANTALFTAAHAVLWRPLPFENPDALVFLWDVGANGTRQPMPPGRGLDFRQSRTLAAVALLSHRSFVVTGAGPVDEWRGASVSGNFFDIVGTPAAVGRTFTAREPSRDLVVISHALWRSRFGGDPAVVGRTLTMNGRPRLVVGVMGADFYWPAITGEPGRVDSPLMWAMADESDVPDGATRSGADPRLDRNTSYLRAVARLAPAVDFAAARRDVAAIAENLAREHPRTDANRSATIVTASEQLFGSVARPMTLLVAVTLLVVLVAAANVANLLLIRLAGRGRELAVRFALGATRGRVIRQLAVEGLMLAAAGAVLGVGVAALSFGTIARIAPDTIGRLDQLTLDFRPLALSLLVTLVTGLLLGLIPGLGLLRRGRALSAGTRGDVSVTRSWLRQTLVAAEIALALVLVVGAVLFGDSLLRLRRVDVGFDPARLLTFDITRGRGSAEGNMSARFNEMLRRVRAVPGVTAAAGAATLPIGGDDFGTRLTIDGQPPPAPGAEPRIGYQLVTQGWFDTLGLRLRGRDFTPADDGTHGQVIIVNDTFARSAWPEGEALGRRVRKGRNPANPWMTVVGVVSDVHHSGPARAARPEIYEPYSQTSLSFMAVAVRTAGDPMAVVSSVRRAIADVDPEQPLANVSTMETHLANAYGDLRFLSTLTLAFGGLALMLAALGVYGVVGATTAQRLREFGVRIALGATPRGLVRLVFSSGMLTVGAGILSGTILALVLGRAVGSLLFETTPTDPSVYVTAALVLLAAAALASWIPARRAGRTDPVNVLRSE